jgi:hypothetical protein
MIVVLRMADGCLLLTDDVDGEYVSGLAARLQAGDLGDFNAVLERVLGEGDLIAEAVLSLAIPGLEPVYRRLRAVSALGDLRGSSDAAAILRTVIANGPGRDLRCVAVIALSKREGEAASPDLVGALSARDFVVQYYAIIGLACVGDGRAVDVVARKLPALFKRADHEHQPTSLYAIAYLGQQADIDQRQALAAQIRSRWDRLTIPERDWLQTLWPEITPSGIDGSLAPVSDGLLLREWARSEAFRPVIKRGRPSPA